MKTVKLKSPIKRGEETITEVTVREPKAGELRGLKGIEIMQMDTKTMLELLPRITNPTLDAAEIAALPFGDFQYLCLSIVSFMEGREGLNLTGL